ncbi:DoxX family protein [Amycolatopsis saalfeldensis]|uniref:DoxX-like family protein n=1 Tax=Amycolatopsis saalfeldensis TaxID=394193 RepID=A0A1H8YQB1_9PSEU|nr:DoxX family protein [Amycolatopsis saalfeldensis]SEP54357.1 DoxX-like family protein [Amycolatopsis saalfeldensis]
MHLVISLLVVVTCGLSGTAALLRFAPIRPGMATAGVPESWLVFPIGTLKATGALGVLIGSLALPPLGTISAFGLVLFFTCAIYTHIRAQDYSAQFGLACGFFLLCLADVLLGVSFR